MKQISSAKTDVFFDINWIYKSSSDLGYILTKKNDLISLFIVVFDFHFLDNLTTTIRQNLFSFLLINVIILRWRQEEKKEKKLHIDVKSYVELFNEYR